MTGFEIFQEAVILFLALAVWYMHYVAKKAQGYAREALTGWQKALDLHAADRQTFVGVYKQADKQQIDWPEEIQ